VNLPVVPHRHGGPVAQDEPQRGGRIRERETHFHAIIDAGCVDQDFEVGLVSNTVDDLPAALQIPARVVVGKLHVHISRHLIACRVILPVRRWIPDGGIHAVNERGFRRFDPLMVRPAVFPGEHRDNGTLVGTADRQQLLGGRIGGDFGRRFCVDVPVFAPVAGVRGLVGVYPPLDLLEGPSADGLGRSRTPRSGWRRGQGFA